MTVRLSLSLACLALTIQAAKKPITLDVIAKGAR